jgi:hypothetical protein
MSWKLVVDGTAAKKNGKSFIALSRISRCPIFWVFQKCMRDTNVEKVAVLFWRNIFFSASLPDILALKPW